MKWWNDIPGLYKTVAAVVAATAFVMTYHNQFITEAEAAEKDKQVVSQLILIRIEAKQEKLERKIDEKAKAVGMNKTVEAEKLEQEIQTLRDQIKGLCDQVDDC